MGSVVLWPGALTSLWQAVLGAARPAGPRGAGGARWRRRRGPDDARRAGGGLPSGGASREGLSRPSPPPETRAEPLALGRLCVAARTCWPQTPKEFSRRTPRSSTPSKGRRGRKASRSGNGRHVDPSEPRKHARRPRTATGSGRHPPAFSVLYFSSFYSLFGVGWWWAAPHPGLRPPPPTTASPGPSGPEWLELSLAPDRRVCPVPPKACVVPNFSERKFGTLNRPNFGSAFWFCGIVDIVSNKTC